MPDKDDFDLLLDSALSTYADPGPDSGLEQRVLTALADARSASERRSPATKTRRWLPWAIAIPVAASLLLWLFIAKFNVPSTPQQQTSQSRPSQPAHDSQVASDSQPSAHQALNSHVAGQVLKGHNFSRAIVGRPSRRALAPEGRTLEATRLSSRAPLPKLTVFPFPQPLTSEEQVLVAAAHRGSDAERNALLEAAKPPSDAPLAIADLTIPPLVPPDESKQ